MLLAWTAATGVQWDFLQLIAYGRMAAGYAATHRVNLAGALEKVTAAAADPCALCRFVASARAAAGAGDALPAPGADDAAGGKTKPSPDKKDFAKKLPFAAAPGLSAPAAGAPGILPARHPGAARAPASPVLEVPVPPPRACC
jgi:hypothetical protein